MKNRRKELDLSADDVAAALNVSRATIFRYEKGDIEKLPGYALEPLAKVLRTSVSYLMGWKEASDVTIDFPAVRYVGPVAAHFNATPTEEYKYRPIPPEWLGRRKPDDFFVATVDGDSMYPHYQDGDELLCLHCEDMGHSGRVGIMLLGDGEATLKKIEYVHGEDWIDLVPANPEYKTRRIEGADLDKCRVVGRVLRVIRTVDEI